MTYMKMSLPSTNFSEMCANELADIPWRMQIISETN